MCTSKMFSIVVLLLFFSTANVMAQHSDKSISIGLNAAYTSDHGAPGIGIHIQKQISPRFEIGAKGDFFIPENRKVSHFGMNSEFEQKMVFASVFGQVNILSSNLLNVYGTAGVIHQRIGYDGYKTVYGDVAPLNEKTYVLESWVHHTGFQIGSGIEFGNNFTFFVEPAVALLETYQFNISSGFRLNL